MVFWNGTPYYYVTNLQGDVIAILDTEGNIVVQYTYDAWGNILTTTGTLAESLGVINPLTYRGYVFDQETGLYYLQSRYYNPAIGRFLNADALVSTGQGLLGNNMFAYCGNNPVQRVDLSGYDYDSATSKKTFLYAEVTHTYGGLRKRYYTWGCAWYGDIRQEIEEVKKAINEADSWDDYVAIAKRVLEYENIEDPVAAYKVPAGIKKIKKGFTLIWLPAPSWLDEIGGAVLIAWGTYSFVMGIGELFDWDGE